MLEGFEPGKVGHVVAYAAYAAYAADAAYDSDAIRRRVKRMKAQACIKPNPRRKVKKRYDKARYKRRNLIERFFARIKEFRRVATRYDKKAANYLGFVWLAAVLTTLP